MTWQDKKPLPPGNVLNLHRRKWNGPRIKGRGKTISNVSWGLVTTTLEWIFIFMRILKHQACQVALRITVDKQNFFSEFRKFPADIEGGGSFGYPAFMIKKGNLVRQGTSPK